MAKKRNPLSQEKQTHSVLPLSHARQRRITKNKPSSQKTKFKRDAYEITYTIINAQEKAIKKEYVSCFNL